MSNASLCVYCRQRPVAPEWRPFCSERCKLADLGRWLSGDYRVAGSQVESEAPRTPSDSDDDDVR